MKKVSLTFTTSSLLHIDVIFLIFRNACLNDCNKHFFYSRSKMKFIIILLCFFFPFLAHSLLYYCRRCCLHFVVVNAFHSHSILQVSYVTKFMSERGINFFAPSLSSCSHFFAIYNIFSLL